jgi:hypothetical protein
MKRIDTATKAVDKFGAGKHGFTNGNVVSGIPSTDLTDSWYDNVQEELANVIEDLGITLDGNNRAQLLAALKGRLINVRVVTSSTTYTPTVGTKAIRVTVQGAGGGGAGSPATSAGQISAGSGGNSGGLAQSYLTNGFAGVPLVIGVGAAVSAPGGAGKNGGATTFGSLISAPGGAGGTITGPSGGIGIAVAQNNSPISTGGNIFNGSTGPGGDAFIFNGAVGRGGSGANSQFGSGPVGSQGPGGGGNATNFGCGGAGALTGSGGGAGYGGAGGNGVIVIEEFA